jgi:HK97 gp10 family phage protein
MAHVVEVRVSGLAQLEDWLEHAPLRISRRILRDALKPAGAIWQRAMADRVRRGPHHPEGGGAEEFGVIADHVSESVSVKSDLEASVRVGVSAKLYWAKFLEFGTGPRARRPREISRSTWRKLTHGTNRMPAFPFVRQSGEENAQAVLDEFTSRAREAIAEEAK